MIKGQQPSFSRFASGGWILPVDRHSIYAVVACAYVAGTIHNNVPKGEHRAIVEVATHGKRI